MVNFYCKACGLYISVSADFAGGRGVCPRCKTALRIPRPLPSNAPGVVEGFRYFAEPDDRPISPQDRAEWVGEEAGDSTQYHCVRCGEEFESLRVEGCEPGQCPRCRTVNSPTVPSIAFPRYDMGKPLPPEEDRSREEGVLVARRSANQDPSDTVIQGLPLLSPGQTHAPGTTLNGAQKHAPDLESELAAVIEARPLVEPKAEPDAVSPLSRGKKWFYLLQNRRHGPVTTETMQRLLQEGKVTPSVLVWREDLKHWRPIEEFEELAVAVEPPEETYLTDGISTMQRNRMFRDRVDRLYWMLIPAVGVLVLVTTTKQTMADIGRTFFVRANLVLAIAMLLGCAHGAMLLRRNWSFFSRLSYRIRFRALFGLAGLLTCAVVTMVLAFSWHGEENVYRDELVIGEARRMAAILGHKNTRNSYLVVDWESLRVNDKDIGSQFRVTSLPKDRTKLIQQVCEEFLTAVVPPDAEKHFSPLSLEQWSVERRGIGGTVVTAKVPASGKTLRFTMQAGRLVAMEIP